MESDLRETDSLLAVKEQTKRLEAVARDNLTKVVARGESLDELQRRTELLRVSAHGFNYSAHRLNRKMFWQSLTLWIVLLLLIIIILTVVIVGLAKAIQNQ